MTKTTDDTEFDQLCLSLGLCDRQPTKSELAHVREIAAALKVARERVRMRAEPPCEGGPQEWIETIREAVVIATHFVFCLSSDQGGKTWLNRRHLPCILMSASRAQDLIEADGDGAWGGYLTNLRAPAVKTTDGPALAAQTIMSQGQWFRHVWVMLPSDAIKTLFPHFLADADEALIARCLAGLADGPLVLKDRQVVNEIP